MGTRTAATPWIGTAARVADPRLRLFCLPYAGGSAATYARWPELLPPDVAVHPVHLPGRASRLGEPPLHHVDLVVDGLLPAVRPLLDRPYVLFGHSMGALIAFELAHRLRADGAPAPTLLVVSARRPPHLPEPYPDVRDLPDEELISVLARRYGRVAGVLSSAELRAALLPALRADFAVCETYHCAAPGERPTLGCPIDVYGGSLDRDVSPAELLGWADYTSGGCTVRLLPGGHFFIEDEPMLLVSRLAATLTTSLSATLSAGDRQDAVTQEKLAERAGEAVRTVTAPA